MAETNGKWKTTQTEFMGFVKAKLEDNEQSVLRIEKKIISNEEKISTLASKLNNMKGTVAIIAVIITAAISGLLQILFN